MFHVEHTQVWPVAVIADKNYFIEGKGMLSIGLMSGTSMDGIDAALLETDGHSQIKELGSFAIDYAPAFKILLKAAEYAVKKTAETAIAQGINDKATILTAVAKDFDTLLNEYLRDLLQDASTTIVLKRQELFGYLNIALSFENIIQHSTLLHGQAVIALLEKTGYTSQQIDLVGCHGQTLFHRPSAGLSIIVCNGASLAEQTGIAVITDFRSCDIAAGGLGAPFAPLYHQALAVRDGKLPCAVVNCGGISNITIIADDQPENLIGFDCGPGNGLVDRLMRQRTGGQESMDKNGHYGQQGQVNAAVLAALYEKSLVHDGRNYFTLQPPKALDIGDMLLIPELDSLSIADACATLEAFTADSIVNSLRLLKSATPTSWILAGGGWHNPVILQQLTERLRQKLGPAVQIQTADAAGWNGQALEAQIFAYLAVRSLLNLPLSVPGTTRVPQPISGGHAHLPTTTLASLTTRQQLAKNPAVLTGYARC